MQNSINTFQAFVTQISSLPRHEKETLFKKMYRAFILGVRALILRELAQENKEEFEKVLMSDDYSSLLQFGYEYIPDFKQKLTVLTDEIAESTVETIKICSKKI